MINIAAFIQRLQQTNQKGYYLAFLRVATSVWLLKELLFRWPAFELLYSNNSFLNFNPGGIYFLHPYLHGLKEHYMLIIYFCILLLLLNIFGIGRNLVSALLFLTLGLLQTINNSFSNGGDAMALLLTFYLSAANTFSHLTLFKRKLLSARKEKLYNMASNLVAYSIMLNLSFIYFMAAIGKLEDTEWRNGMALNYYINNEHYFIFASSARHTALPKIIVYFFTYAVILLELTAPFLIWIRKFRLLTFSLLILMHLVIYCFFMIYGMSLIFILQYGLFFSEKEIKGVVQKVKSIFLKRRLKHETSSLP